MSNVRPEVKKLYYSISEVSKLTKLKAYVLRYWETEFTQLKPSKNRAGNRTYRQKDIDLILKIKDLLYEEKYTIEGARIAILKKNQSVSSGVAKSDNKSLLNLLRIELEEILQIINK